MGRDEFEALWLDTLRADASDTVSLLNNPRKPERERRTVAAYLRCAGVSFTSKQLVSSETEPPDVLFENARFEIALVQDDRKMHDEWKAKAKHRAAAKAVSELLERYHPPETLSRQQVIDLIIPIATQKADKYSARKVACKELDLLLYVNKNAALDMSSLTPGCDVLKQQEWRSVSVLFPPYSYVVLASDTAPEFIRSQVEKPTAAWPAWNGMFDI